MTDGRSGSAESPPGLFSVQIFLDVWHKVTVNITSTDPTGDYYLSHKCLSKIKQQPKWSIPRKFSA